MFFPRLPHILLRPLTILWLLSIALSLSASRKIRFSDAWKFNRGSANGAQATDFNDDSWETVYLPHTVREELDYRTSDIYMGTCWYRKTFTLPSASEGKTIYLEFGAAMQSSEVWVNGTSVIEHAGGYDPFVIDITDRVNFDEPNVVAITMDNRSNGSIPPGNSNPDFLYFGGLYQDVYLYIKENPHISNPVLENIPGGGGVFVTYSNVSSSSATVQVKTHVVNKGNTSASCAVTSTITGANGTAAASNTTAAETIAAGDSHTFSQDLAVANPNLWTPDTPNLYTLHTEVTGDGAEAAPVDTMSTTIGIRTINWSKSGGLTINGQRVKLHGCNRHMSYPYIGNAVPASGQYRDALRIKEFGFNFVRMSHYMQPESFVDACDKLGVAGMACLPGWQYYNDNQSFRNNSISVLRNTIRVYRNHPSVIVYESMHNESRPSSSFLNEANRVAHEEYPGDQMFTCGEEEGNILDVYVSSSQHGVRDYNGARSCIISEYGDWEHGCVWNSSGPVTGCRNRLERSAGASALSTMQSTRAGDFRANEACSWFTADGVWTIFDYQSWDKMPYTGSGDMDIFRIPKYDSYAPDSHLPLFDELNSGSAMKVVIDTANLQFIADGSDIAIVYVSNVTSDVTFSVSGPGSLVGQNPAKAIAGIASILLRAGTTDDLITVSASSGSSSANATVTSHPENLSTGITFPPTRPMKSPAAPTASIRRVGTGIAITIHGAETNESAAAKFILYNSAGRVVGQWKLNKSVTTIENCSQAKGVYIGRIVFPAENHIKKMVW